jgi:hypothetical protein
MRDIVWALLGTEERTKLSPGIVLLGRFMKRVTLELGFLE